MLQSIFGGSRKRFGLVAEKLLLSFSLWLIDCTFIKLLLKALLIFIITKPTSPQNYHIVSVTRRSGSDAGEWVSDSCFCDFTIVTLVREDTYWRLDWCDSCKWGYWILIEMMKMMKSYLVIQVLEVRIVKEVIRSDGLCRFACGDVYILTQLWVPPIQRHLITPPPF